MHLFFKEKKGMTIVEVLVSLVIIMIVSIYGVSFFSSAYRLSIESSDYNTVLYELTRKLECAIGGKYQAAGLDYKTPYTYDNLHGVSNTTDKLFMYKNQVLRLRTGCTVKFTYRAYANSRTINGSTSKFYGSTELIVEARWPTEYEDTSAEKAKSMNKISLGTFVAQNWAH